MARKKYTQEQQVIDVLRQIGGYATLGDLYRLVDTKIVGDQDAQRVHPENRAAI